MKSAGNFFLPVLPAIRLFNQRVIRPRGIRLRETRVYIVAFGLSVVTVGCFVGLHIASLYQYELAYWQARESSVAGDQARMLSDWLKGRQADVHVFATRPSIRAALQTYDEAGHSAKSLSDLPTSLDVVARLYAYAGIYVLDLNGRMVAHSSGAPSLDPSLAGTCRAAAHMSASRIDLLGDAPDRSVISFSAPVFPGPRTGKGERGQPRPLGVVVVVLDALQTAFPLVTRESVPTRTGETVLVRRQRDDIVFFSPLRNVPAGSSNPGFPFSSAPLPARLALEGREAFVQYSDYRRVPVLAATRHIPQTGWGLVRKIDRAEALADFHRQALGEGLAGGLLIILLGGLLVFHRREVLSRVVRQEEQKFRAFLESAPDAIYILDPTTLRILARNRRAAELDGYSGEEVAHMTAADLHPPEERAILPRALAQGSETGPTLRISHFHHRRKDGRLVPVEESQTLVQVGGERLVMSIVHDITKRKQAELELSRLNRALRTMTYCNQVVVRAQSEQELLDAVCTNLVEVVGYRMVWVGYAEHDPARTVRPVAHAGFEEGYLNSAGITWADDARGHGPTGSAIRTGLPVVNRNSETHVTFSPWREEALKRGYASSIGLPLRAGSQVLGALSVYSAEGDAFDDKEVKLLSELAEDIGFGIDTIRVRAQRKRAEELLERERELFDILMNNIPDKIYFKDTASRFVRINRAHALSLGLTDPAEAIGKTDFDFRPQQIATEAYNDEKKIIETGEALVGKAERISKPGGQVRWNLVTKVPFKNTEGQVVGIVGISRDITQKKEDEERLRTNEERFRTIAETITEVFWIADPSITRLFYISPGYERVWGRSLASLYENPRSFLEAIHPEDREQVLADFGMQETGQQFDHEYRIIRPDGSLRWIWDRELPIRDGAGEVTCYVGVAEDITERKQADEKLKASEEKFRKAFMTAVDAFYIATLREGRIIEVNDRFEDVFGYTGDEAIGKTSLELGLYQNPADQQKLLDIIRLAGHVRNLELQGRKKGGELVTILLSANVLARSAEQIMIGVVRDITEQKRAEEALVRLRQAVHASGEVVFMTDPEGVFTFINPEFTRLYGYTEAEVVGKVTPRILKSGAQPPEKYVDFWKKLYAKQVVRGQIVNRAKDDRLLVIHSSVSPILDDTGNITGFLAIQRDVTERKRLEEQFIQAQRMEAVGRLAAGVAHDFNNLLTIISGHSGLMLRQLPSDSPARESFAEIKDAGERAAGLTRQLLAFSRQQVRMSSVLNLNTLVADSIKMLRRLIGEDIELVFDPVPDLGMVCADPGQIEQILMNLAVNSRDAMPKGGKLTIKVSNFQADKAYVPSHCPVRPGAYVQLAVSDTGCGMDAETQSRIFEPFFTTKGPGKGTGLGLATVYGIVKQNGGYIWVCSELGKGTTFKICLPVVQGSPEATDAGEAKTSGSETVLLVEDEINVRSLARTVLETEGYKVLEAASGMEALLIANRHCGPIHMLLTDVVMPVMSGRELAERLAKSHSQMKILYTSGYTGDMIVHHGVLESRVAFLQKPYAPEVLARKVREVLDA